MGAEHLIALEAALAEISGLYVIVKDFRPLHERAERDLLPAITELGARLRHFVRIGSLNDAAIDAAARDIAALRSTWRLALEDLHHSDLYRSCLHAYTTQDRDRLIAAVPLLFAGCELTAAPSPLYYPLSPSSGRRRPGRSPFLSAATCADRIGQIATEGLRPDTSGTEWWDTEIIPLTLSSDATAFDTPIALHVRVDGLATPVFRTDDRDVFRIYAPAVGAPIEVVLHADVEDEWWQAFSGSYVSWRDELDGELRARKIPTRVIEERQ